MWTYAVPTYFYSKQMFIDRELAKLCTRCIGPNLENMHVFGTIRYAYVQNKTKLDARSERGTFVGHDRSSPVFLVYFKAKNLIRRVRMCKFTEKFEVQNMDVESYFEPIS